MQSKVLFSVAVMLSLTNAVKIHSMEEIYAVPADAPTINADELIDAAVFEEELIDHAAIYED